MSVIEVVRLRPAEGVSEQEFLAASDRFEQNYMKSRPGFLKRTLLRDDNDEWLVLVEWETAADAENSMDAFPTDPASAPFNAVLDPQTFEMKRFAIQKIFMP